MDFARLLVIKSDFNLGRLVHRNVEVLVPPVRFGIMGSGALGTVDLDEYEGVDPCLGSRPRSRNDWGMIELVSTPKGYVKDTGQRL